MIRLEINNAPKDAEELVLKHGGKILKNPAHPVCLHVAMPDKATKKKILKALRKRRYNILDSGKRCKKLHAHTSDYVAASVSTLVVIALYFATTSNCNLCIRLKDALCHAFQ